VSTKPATFTTLAPWKSIATEDALETYPFDDIVDGEIGLDDLFGETPEKVRVHRGSLSAAAVELDGWKAGKQGNTLHIVDGDLTVAGHFLFAQDDITTTLWVTGDLIVSRLACLSSAVLIVGGTLTVCDTLVTNLEDAGWLIAPKQVLVARWIDLGRGRGGFLLPEPTPTALTELRAGLDDHSTLLDAFRSGAALAP
jgi:hypothetical protein